MLNKTKTTPFKVSLQELSFECFLFSLQVTNILLVFTALNVFTINPGNSKGLQTEVYSYLNEHIKSLSKFITGSNITKSTVTIYSTSIAKVNVGFIARKIWE